MRQTKQFSRRRFLAASGCFLLVNACEAKSMKVVLNVVLFSYLDRPIFEVEIDGKADENSGVYPNTGGGTTVGVEFTLGPKKVSWKLDGPKGAPRTGETVRNKNKLELNEVVPGARYLAVHIYPDETVELLTSVARPYFSARGQEEIAKIGSKHGK